MIPEMPGKNRVLLLHPLAFIRNLDREFFMTVTDRRVRNFIQKIFFITRESGLA